MCFLFGYVNVCGNIKRTYLIILQTRWENVGWMFSKPSETSKPSNIQLKRSLNDVMLC